MLGGPRGSHIWSQKLNRTSFDHLLGQKTVENGIFPVFDSFFGQKGVQMLFDLNFETIFEIPSAFPVYKTNFLLKLTRAPMGGGAKGPPPCGFS